MVLLCYVGYQLFSPSRIPIISKLVSRNMPSVLPWTSFKVRGNGGKTGPYSQGNDVKR